MGDIKPPAQTVADLRRGENDVNGDPVYKLYWRKAPDYAVYKTRERGVSVHFSDTRGEAMKQRRQLAPLTPLRDEIDGLVQGWRSAADRGFFGLSNPERLNDKAECADRRVGGALIQALEEDAPGAQLLLEKIKSDILNERIAWARFEYLLTAFGTVLCIMFGAWLLASVLPAPAGYAGAGERMWKAGVIVLVLAAAVAAGVGTAKRPPLKQGRVAERPPGESDEQAVKQPHPAWRAVWLFAIVAIPVFAILIWPGKAASEPVQDDYGLGVSMWRGAAAGAVGAFFSISLAIRGRTVLPDLLRTANMMDAVLRVLIGTIAGAALIALVAAKIVTSTFATNPEAPLFVLIAGFLAGFAERLVPDLLDKVSVKAVEFDPELAAARARQAKPAEDVEPARTDSAPTAGAAAVAVAAAKDDAVNDNIVDNDADVPKEGLNALNDDENTQDEDLPLAIGGVAKS